MTIIYDELVDFSTNVSKWNATLANLISEMCDQPYDEVDDFIKNVVILSLTKYGIIRDAYPLLKELEVGETPLLTQAILLMSYAHYYFVEKSDKRVVIDVAVNLAKKIYRYQAITIHQRNIRWGSQIMDVERIIYSVNDINQYVKAVLSQDAKLKYILVKGEISNFKNGAAGHLYFFFKGPKVSYWSGDVRFFCLSSQFSTQEW